MARLPKQRSGRVEPRLLRMTRGRQQQPAAGQRDHGDARHPEEDRAHQKFSSMAPDQVIDRATEPPATEAQMPIARGRSAGGNTVARVDSHSTASTSQRRR
jgi:hypothetical protein